ncbi:uncharacterized protein PHACADRAFT_85929, partial [Phanerochaete carnosa HHB-10118-sp]
ISPENIYNMDEKGIQLGVRKKVQTLVDHDQRTLYLIENGLYELVTIIETICTDRTALKPCVIFQAKCINLQWSQNNLCDARYELGVIWLEKNFEPETIKCNCGSALHLLISDRHNSHCTYCFIRYAANHNILVVCLLSHTTHALQPCNVGVFGPLASAWKVEVSQALPKYYISICKDNLLDYYHQALQHAMKLTTVISAAKVGIHPWNPDTFDPSFFAPSLNTTTEAAQPMPT